MNPLEAPGAPKMEPKITPGGAQDAEKWSKNFSGGPPAGTSEISAHPEASKSAPEPIYIALTWPPGSHLGPREAPEAGGPGGLRELIFIIFRDAFFATC